MSGFASLSWAEWQATTKSAARKQRKECLLWMNELWEKAALSDWEKEWKHLREAVRHETLWNACNVSQAVHKKKELPAIGSSVHSKRFNSSEYASWLESTVFGREAEKSKVWLSLMSDMVNWNQCSSIPKEVIVHGVGSQSTILAHDSSVWLTHVLQNDWEMPALNGVYEIAKERGWNLKEIPSVALERVFFLNAVSDAQTHKSEWLLEKLEVENEGALYQPFPPRSDLRNRAFGEDSTPFLMHIKWNYVERGSCSENSGFRFWSDRVHQLSWRELDEAVNFFQMHVSKKAEAPGNVDAWIHLVASIERFKLKERLMPLARPGETKTKAL